MLPFPGVFLCYLGQFWPLKAASPLPFPSPGQSGGEAAVRAWCPVGAVSPREQTLGRKRGTPPCRQPDRYLSPDEAKCSGAVPWKRPWTFQSFPRGATALTSKAQRPQRTELTRLCVQNAVRTKGHLPITSPARCLEDSRPFFFF